MKGDADQTVTFLPATDLPYECTIHTLSMRDDEGRVYDVVLDLVRGDKNLTWGITRDRMALRAAVLDREAGLLVASTFVDAPRDAFAREVGALHIMDARGRIAFESARGSTLADLDFELTATLHRSTLVQTACEWGKTLVERCVGAPTSDGSLDGSAGWGLRLPLQLAVTDFPRSSHSGTLTIARQDGERPLRLVADGAPSTVSHHWGNALTEYVFVASVPAIGQPSFIAVVTREVVRPDAAQPSWTMSFPVGYLIVADEHGRSTFSLLHPRVTVGSNGERLMGASRFGWQVQVRPQAEAGSVTLNDGQLPTATAFGAATLSRAGKSLTFPRVVLDVTGRFNRSFPE